VRSGLEKLKEWHKSRSRLATSLDAGSGAADAAADDEEVSRAWERFFDATKYDQMKLFLEFYDKAEDLPEGGITCIPPGPCGVAMATASAIGSTMRGFCVIPSDDCYTRYWERDRAHLVVALTRAGAGGCTVFPSRLRRELLERNALELI